MGVGLELKVKVLPGLISWFAHTLNDECIIFSLTAYFPSRHNEPAPHAHSLILAFRGHVAHQLLRVWTGMFSVR